MKRIEFETRAASHYLCDDDEFSIEEQLQKLKEHNDGYDLASNVEGVIVWDMVDGISVESLLDQIDILADDFEELYNKK